MHKPLMTVVDPPFMTRVIDRRDAEQHVEEHLDYGTPIPWDKLSDIAIWQAREKLKDEACDAYNINYRGSRVSKALIALVESHR